MYLVLITRSSTDLMLLKNFFCKPLVAVSYTRLKNTCMKGLMNLFVFLITMFYLLVFNLCAV